MNPSNPFSGQQAAVFPAPPGSPAGVFQAQPPFRFGQPSLFGQSPAGFAQPPGFPPGPASGNPPSGQVLGFPPPPGAGLRPAAPPVPPSGPAASGPVAGSAGFRFKAPTALGAYPGPASFGLPAVETPTCGFRGAEFSFKPPDNATFRPIFGAEAEPERTQGQIAPGSFTFSHSASGGPGGLAPFHFSPASGGPGPGAAFGFPKSAGGSHPPSPFSSAPPSSKAEEERRGLKPAFGSPNSSFTSLAVSPLGSAGDPSAVVGRTAGQQARDEAGQAEPPPGLLKGLKRKEERDRSPRRRDYDTAEDPDPSPRGDRPPDKRPVRLTRPRRGGLFGRTLKEMLKSNKDGGRPPCRDSRKESVSFGGGEPDRLAAPAASQPVFVSPRASGAMKEEETESKEKKEDSAGAGPSRRSKRTESADSLGGLSPSELTAIQCKNIPDYLNDRTVLEKHFGRFAKVQRIYTKRSRKLAVVHFFDHDSAAQARKKGKGLHKDMTIFWHKKKISPSKKEFSPKEKKSDESEVKPNPEEPSFTHSPLRKPLVRPAASGSLLSKSSPVKKPGLIKALQFETDPFDSGSEGQGPEGLGTSVPSLSNLVGTVAETAEEKYRLLDQRDKIMRQARVKRTDLDKAKTFVGTCPDMCPEKERYMRETRNQLSIFELIPGTDQVDHSAAVKEYSRSSADQEEPLPHELRPSGVLSMTMDYLVMQIMDQKEGSSRDWYDFVWNRTRGIRKDITQQHLCDPLTVSLIEKCTRFHIHCAHYMCEEPMSSFDAKINNENMTKCLQSLKEMYQDLANKGVFCKSEAEFRGYNVLLNLNKGDILREVQQFQPSVRNSPEVKFAVQAFAALNSNNFVRFFKLVRTASYLNACLLHCYFNQIRKDALKALNIAYTVSLQRSTVFPLDNLVQMLLFRDSEEATDFLSFYGLSVSDGFVELSRSAFMEPEGLSKAKRSMLITQKLSVSVGEVVNGGPFPPVTPHIPVCSFNNQNKYIGESTAPEPVGSSQKAGLDVAVSPAGGIAEERSSGAEALMMRGPSQLQPAPLAQRPAATPVPLPGLLTHGPGSLPPVPPSLFQPVVVPPELPPPQPRPIYTDQDIARVVEELVEDVLKKDCEEISRTGAGYASAALCVSSAVVEELVADAVADISRQITAEEMNAERKRIEEEKRRAEEARRKLERELVITQLSQALVEDLTDIVVKECVRETSSRELKCAVEIDQRARVARCSEEVCVRLMDLFLEDEIFQSAKETLQELQCFCKYLQRWREAVAARKKLKRQMRAFPAAPCCVDQNDRLKALSPSAECPIAEENLARGILNLGNAGKLGVYCTRLRWLRNKAIHQMKVQYFYQQLVSEAAWSPLNLPSLIAEHYPGQKEQVFWKLVLVLPESEETPSAYPSSILSSWLKVKFMGEVTKGESYRAKDSIQTLALFNSVGYKGDRAICINVCVKVAQGTLSDSALDATETQKDLLGTSGLILLLPTRIKSEDFTEEDVYWLSALLQLKQLLQAKPFQPMVPLVVLVPSQGEDTSEQEVEEGLMLQDLISAKLISDYIIVEIPDSVNDLQGTNRVSASVQWLVAHCPGSLELCCQTLLQFIEDGVSCEFSDRFFHDRKERRLAGLPSQEPSAIIDLYNSVLQFLAAAASSEQLCDLSWPVTEFAEPGGSKLLPHLQWNTPDHLAWLKKAVLSFQIPQMDLPPLGAPWRPVCSMIFQYVSQIPSCRQTQPILQSQVENLLSRTYSKWKSKASASSRESGPPVEEIPWDDILALCINHKLRDWKSPKTAVTSEAVSEDGQVCVYFFKEHLKKYELPLSWEQARLQTQKEIQRSQGSLGVKSPECSAKRCPPSLLQIPFSVIRKPGNGKEGRIPSAEELIHTASAEELLPERLTSSIQLEKEENKRFEDMLHQWLAEDSVHLADSTSLPLYLPEALVSVPQSIQPPVKSPRTSPQNTRAVEEKQTAAQDRDLSLSDKLMHLERLIKSTKEEEIACERHLSTLLDMVDI
ncbi:germinal-center associated nuclear protein [Tachyglossus aculeatus]|uniref:germinal-center associated nuclear protein n=1 Tax=Tachyglossus aculeatus TaxID=9261 RepID=UPI0018F28FD9|nr:germinal-center associated nuclear protein [Tachyglossus aculeatus]